LSRATKPPGGPGGLFSGAKPPNVYPAAEKKGGSSKKGPLWIFFTGKKGPTPPCEKVWTPNVKFGIAKPQRLPPGKFLKGSVPWKWNNPKALGKFPVSPNPGAPQRERFPGKKLSFPGTAVPKNGPWGPFQGPPYPRVKSAIQFQPKNPVENLGAPQWPKN